MAGNQRTLGPLNLLVDTVAPVATITAPLPNSDSVFYTESAVPAFTAEASDPEGTGGAGAVSGLARVDFFYAAWISPQPTTWAGFVPLSSDDTAPYAAAYSGLPEGHYIFAVRATDKAGNQSALMSGPVYKSGVTQEVFVDSSAPAVAITAPTAGQLVPDATNLTITWTLTDVSAPSTVKIDYSDNNGASWTPIAAAAPSTPGAAGSYIWAVPDIAGADVTTYRIRVTAVDRAGAPLGNIPGHTTVELSGAFTIYDSPAEATNVSGQDPDGAVAGVDGRDFSATWTVSTSLHISSQKVYLLPESATLDLNTAPAETPVATYSNNTTAAWTGTAGLTKDSLGANLVAGNYRIWIVVTDVAGRTAIAPSNSFGVAAP
jgi:hypothetical protein